MENYASEKEQIEALKKWWKENGSSTITGVLLGLTVIFGGKAWFGYQARQHESASHLYVQFMNALGQQDAAAVSKAGDALVSEFSGSPYAVFAAMGMAQQQIDQGQPDAARAQLQWALDHAKPETIQHSARLRLVRLLIAQGELENATALLAQAPATPEYAPLYAELRGDLALTQGNRSVAGEAYAEALAQLPPEAPTRALVQAKWDDVQ